MYGLDGHTEPGPAFPNPPPPQFAIDDVFRFVVHVMQTYGAEVVFDFYRLPGGPYGYALPASVTWNLNRKERTVYCRTIYSGFPPVFFSFPADRTRRTVAEYLSDTQFVRVTYLDATGFKVHVARREQLACGPGPRSPPPDKNDAPGRLCCAPPLPGNR